MSTPAKLVPTVKETSTTSGTADYTLDGASGNFDAFSAHYSNGDLIPLVMAIDQADTSIYELFGGVISIGGSTTIARTHIYASSNGGAKVNQAAGTRSIFVPGPGDAYGRQFGPYMADPANSPITRPDFMTNLSMEGLWIAPESSTQEDWYWFDGAADILIGRLNPTANTWIPARNGTLLGDVVTYSIGTSGAVVGLLNASKTDSGDNIFSGANTFSGRAQITGIIGHEPTTKTISSGSITPTTTNTIVAAESGTADTLDAISLANFEDDDIIFLKADAGDTITITHGAVYDLAGGEDYALTGEREMLFRVDATAGALYEIGYRSSSGFAMPYKNEAIGSGSSKSFTGLDSAADVWMVHLTDVSLTGTGNIQMRVSDGTNTSSWATILVSAGLSASLAATFSLWVTKISGTSYEVSGTVANSGGAARSVFASMTLGAGGPADRFEIQTDSGTFDAGSGKVITQGVS